MEIKEKIIKAIQKAGTALIYADADIVKRFKSSGIKIVSEVPLSAISVESTENLSFGDYTTNFPMYSYRQMAAASNSHVPGGKKEGATWANLPYFFHSPVELAEKIVEKLRSDKDLIGVVEKIEVAGPGFINFWLKSDALTDNLIQIGKEKEKYGNSSKKNGKTAIIEYSSPNIAKPFTIGHLRSTIIGDAIANLLEATGWKVMRDNHLGDWGTQFGKQIYAIKTWGKKDPNAEYSVKELVDLYVKFHEEAEKDKTLDDKARGWFKKLEDGDSEAKRIWQKCIDWSFVEFDRIYNILGIKFSAEFQNGRGLGESFFESRMKAVIEELEKNKLLKVGEEGAKLVFFENDKYSPAMILKKDGATLYHTRDLATDKYRKDKYDPDLIVNEVGSEQALYFRQLFEMEKLLGWFAEGQRVHVGHGMVRFKEGKMSTRKGNVIWMEDVLNESLKRATILTATSGQARSEWGKPEDILSQKIKIDQDIESGNRNEDIRSIAIGALKYNDLKRDPKTDIVFDWDEILNMEGNSGPYLQYTVARCNSVITKANVKDGDIFTGVQNKAFSELEASNLRMLIHFDEVIVSAARNYSPNLLCNYLYELAQEYNSFYNKEKIIGSENEKLRLALTFGVAQVLKNGLKLLGIESPDRM